MSKGHSERGEIRLRSLFEMGLIFLFAYSAVQVGPAVVLRLKFLDEMTVAANSPIEMGAGTIKRELMEKAEGFGLTLLSDNLSVMRDRDRQKTFIVATYEIHISFWPAFTYVWTVRDEVVGYYF